MDFFKVVATKEKNGVYFTAVPHQWERDKVLYWPHHLNHSRREALRCNSASAPEESWVHYSCILKLSNINNFKDALQIEKQLTNCLDTDAEEELFNNTKKFEPSKKNASYPTDRNYMFSECQSSKNVINIISQQKFVPASSTPDEDEVNTTNTPNDDVAEENTTNFDNSSADDKDAPNRINKHYPTNQVLIVDEDGMIDINTLSQPQKLDIVMELSTIKEDIRSIKNEMSNMKKEIKAQYIKINLSLDKIYQMISEKDQSVNKGARITEQTHKEDFLKKFSFPLASCQEISKLDQEIRTNCEFKSQLVEFLSRIGGVSGEEDGGKIAYKLVDSLFNPDVLVNYSWTGVSRGNTVEKKSFQSFEGILALVFEVLLLADNRHTKQKNASIFKDGVLKHAKKRSLRKWRRSKTGDDNRITVNTAEDANYEDMSGATSQDMGDEVDILDDEFEKNTENDL